MSGLEAVTGTKLALALYIVYIAHIMTVHMYSTSAGQYIFPTVQFLSSTGEPLLANLYTYLSYIDNPQHVGVGYDLLN
ncbi:hypothetical protein D5086_002310 [Populus alba]|uniref:Uncharacterized protein n=1 Tax=Populus alba TaxID=43335 RepID=A0ACC4D2C0_POPAL